MRKQLFGVDRGALLIGWGGIILGFVVFILFKEDNAYLLKQIEVLRLQHNECKTDLHKYVTNDALLELEME